MKTLLAIILTLSATAIFSQDIKTTSFTVQGNCSQCKKHIEKAVAVSGVKKADWNKDSKKMTVSYDPALVTPDALQLKIAAVGYDTEKYRADDKAYSKLDECCQYDRKKAASKTGKN